MGHVTETSQELDLSILSHQAPLGIFILFFVLLLLFKPKRASLVGGGGGLS